MGPRDRAAAARHAQIFIPVETPRSHCCGRAAGPGAAAVLLAALALAIMEVPEDEARAEPASPQTPPLHVPPTLDDIERQTQGLGNRIHSLEISFGDLLRILIGITTEQRAAPPPRRNYNQQLRNLLPTGSSAPGSSADPAGAAEAAADDPGAADDEAAPPARRRRLG